MFIEYVEVTRFELRRSEMCRMVPGKTCLQSGDISLLRSLNVYGA